MKQILGLLLLILITACTAQQPKEQASDPGGTNHANPSPDGGALIQSQQNNQTSGPETKQQGQESSADEVMLDVPIIAQNPELKFGCEVTSLTMLLRHAGIQADKMKLAAELPKDNDPVVKSKSGDITHWGNPEHGFVGDITGRTKGYAVYVKPLEALMMKYLPDRTVNLTGGSFDDVIAKLREGKPVVVWTTGDYKLPDRWESWKHGQEEIRTPLDLHAVVVVGFNPGHVFVNDPLTGRKAQKVNKQTFIDTWVTMGKQALTYR
ncbi:MULTISPECIES: C39 family peptidase [unclassified Paenibacillus]|uniref:C39 family peptidase n=1 Tax=unclassified Paenibacillus TaxID=185978 RepID=UPI002117BBF3|nr:MULTISPECIES: C39 family peptidase [unclassified Paenibacillus]